MDYQKWQDIAYYWRCHRTVLFCHKCNCSIISAGKGSEEMGWYYPQSGEIFCTLCWVEEQTKEKGEIK